MREAITIILVIAFFTGCRSSDKAGNVEAGAGAKSSATDSDTVGNEGAGPGDTDATPMTGEDTRDTASDSNVSMSDDLTDDNAEAVLVVREPTDVAADMFGLSVGARWTYLRSGDVVRWKEITACEDIPIIDGDTLEKTTVRAYVRENRNLAGLTSIHYLVVDESGVRRVRRDDIDGKVMTMFATYKPANTRLLDGPYTQGETRSFEQRVFEFTPENERPRGGSNMSAMDLLLGEKTLVVAAGTFPTVGVDRQWFSNTAHQVVSYYAAGIGEIREETTWPNGDLQIEELVEYRPGYASCGPFSAGKTPLSTSCGPPLLRCENSWGSGFAGCTDPRVDAANCGACGTICPSGVCAQGACVTPTCNRTCLGTTLCCSNAWGWQQEGCTSPARDPWNCGVCGHACGIGLICDRGACVCASGSRDCNGDGLCEPVMEDQQNCGECGRVCPADKHVCDFGVCTDAACLSVDLTACDGRCADLMWDSNHCGACGHRCGAGTGTLACVYGVCETCEEAGLTDCAGDCVDLDWSDNHCGFCGNDCAQGEVCVFGVCTGGDDSCTSPCQDKDQICCDGTCINPRRSDNHCGGCNVQICRVGDCTEACRAGECVPVDCGGGDD